MNMDREESKNLAVTARLVEDMHKRLFGDDGNAGVIAQIDTRVSTLENAKAKGEGIFWAFSTLFTLLGGTELLHWFKGK